MKKAGSGAGFFLTPGRDYFFVSVVVVVTLPEGVFTEALPVAVEVLGEDDVVPLGVVDEDVEVEPGVAVVVVVELVELAGGVVAGVVTVVDELVAGGVTLVSVFDSQATRPTARIAASRYDGFIVRIPSLGSGYKGR